MSLLRSMRLSVGMQRTWVAFERSLQIEPLDAQNMINRHEGFRAALNRCESVDAAQTLFDAREAFFARHQIDLVEEQPICKSDLADCLVHRPLGLLLIQVLLNVFRVHQRDDTVQSSELLDVSIDEQGLDHRGRLPEKDRDTVIGGSRY